MLKLTITATAVGAVTIQDTFPAEGKFCTTLAASASKTVDFTYAQYNHIKDTLDNMVEAGMLNYTVVDTEEARSDELLELKERTAKVVTLAVTGGTVPNLVTLGIRKGDVFVKTIFGGATLTYVVDEVNSATAFTALTTVVAFNMAAAGDVIYFTRDGVLITNTDRTVAGPITNLIATVSQSAYQRSGFGRFYVKASDSKPYFMMDTGMELSLGMTGSDPLVFKGAIAVAADFPLIAAVQTGWLYRVTADVTDNAGVTYTNTGLSFLAGAEIAWNGSTWSELGTIATVQEKHAAGAFTLPAGSSTTFVDTATAGAGTSCTLPAASATKLGEIIAVGDYTGSAGANNITINRTGGDTIDGVAANLVLNKNNIFVALECVSATGYKTIYRSAPVSSAATPAAIGTAAAGTSQVCSPDDHVHNLVAGATTGRVARTGAGAYAVRQDNLAAAVDPIATDDVAAGYGIDSLWINTTAVPPRVFQCTNPGAGVAVWRRINALNNYTAVIPPVVGDDDTLGYDVGSVWIDTATDLIYICAHNATGAAVWRLSLNAVAAGGELAGTYPNPTVADGVLDAANALAGAVPGLMVDKGTPSSCLIAFDNAGAAQRPADGASYTFSIGGVPLAAIEARDVVVDQYDFLRSSAGAEEADTITMATAFAACINANTVIGLRIRAVVYGGAGDGRWYVACYTRLQADITAGSALTCVLAGGQPGFYAARATAVAASKRQVFPFRYEVTAQDVLAGEIRFNFGGSAVVAYGLDILTAAANYTRIAWTGAVTIAGGELCVDNSAGTDWAVGNILTGWMLCTVA
jgi:hypothetical protein